MAQKHPCCIDEVATVGGEGGEREEGSGKVVEGIDDTNGAQQMVVPAIDINQPPVDYQSVCKLPSKDKMYKEIIMKNISALFPEGCKGTGLSVFVGALYAHTARGKPIDTQHPETSRLVFFGGSTPEKPGMQVAKTSLGEETVLRYSWDRINLVYYQESRTPGSSEYTFQIFTPAISDTYGLQATDKETIFEMLPGGEKHEEYYSLFQITTRGKANYITTTTQNVTLGLYVDTTDGWKVKVTKKQEYWDKFRIGRFELPLSSHNQPPATDPSPVHWEPVCNMQQSWHIKYKELIMRERTPALFADWEDCGLYFHIGAMYVYSASGKGITRRRVYFEASDPKQPFMRVSDSDDTDVTVATTFGWDRTNFVFRSAYLFNSLKHNFQLYTPANHGTYGIRVQDGRLTFEALPEDQKAVEFFTYFQIIKSAQNQQHITNSTQTLGLYVDTQDGWKVKMTNNNSLWDKFRIEGFTHPTHPPPTPIPLTP